MTLYQTEHNAHIVRLDNEYEIKKELVNIKVDRKAFDILTQKMSFVHIKIEKVDTRAANIIKQYLSNIGGEAAISQDAYTFTERTTDMIISASKKNMKLLAKKIEDGKYGLPEIAKEIERNLFLKMGVLKLNKNILDFNKNTYIMGVINFSKSDFTEKISEKNIIKKVEGMIKSGAKIIDICDECFYKKSIYKDSSGDMLIHASSVIRSIKNEFPDIIMSIDTSKINVAKECLEAGIDIINETIPLKYSEELVNLISKIKCPIILIYNPMNLNNQPKPLVSISEVIRDIQSNISFALGNGIEKDKIIIDPGIGFGRSDRDNFLMLKQLSSFKYFNMPILVGLSRRSFLGEALKGKLDNSLISTIAANTMAIINGANIIRVHTSEEVLAMKNIIDSIKKSDDF